MNKLLLLSALLISNYSVSALECGDSIDIDTVMTKDLDCSEYEGFAALQVKDNAVLNGRGHTIISPNTSVGIYAEGEIIKIRNVNIEGSEDAIGVMGYNVKKLIVNKVSATDMFIGVDYYTADDYDCDRVRVSNSNLSSNEYGVRVNSPKCEYTPRFVNTDFSLSKSYALNVTAKIIRIKGILGNDFSSSANGLLLKSSDKTVIQGLDLSDSDIQGTQVFAYDSKFVKILDSNFGNNEKEGVHLYDVEKVILRRVIVDNSGVGIKVANDRVSTSFLGRSVETSGNYTAGLLLTSSNDIKFSEIDFPERKNNITDDLAIVNQ